MLSFLICLFLKSCLHDNSIKEISKEEISDLLYFYGKFINIEIMSEITLYGFILYCKLLSRIFI